LLLCEAVAHHYCLFDPGGVEEFTGVISCLRVLIWVSTFARHFHGLQRCQKRRRIKLTYHLRVRCLTACVRYGVQRKKRRACNRMTKPGSERKDASETTQVRQCVPNEITRFLQGVDPLLHHRQLVDWNIERASKFLRCCTLPPHRLLLCLSTIHLSTSPQSNDQ
jgi:hypothetical protein